MIYVYCISYKHNCQANACITTLYLSLPWYQIHLTQFTSVHSCRDQYCARLLEEPTGGTEAHSCPNTELQGAGLRLAESHKLWNSLCPAHSASTAQGSETEGKGGTQVRVRRGEREGRGRCQRGRRTEITPT